MSDSALSPQEKAEQEDKKLLSETNKKIQEIMQLLGEGHTRESARKKVNDAKFRAKADVQRGGKELVFHPYNGGRFPVTRESSNNLILGDALELTLKTAQYNKDLQKALQTLSSQRINVLERLLKNGKVG
jgi:hypothetical protein